MSLVNCRVEVSLNRIENSVLTVAEFVANADATVQIVQTVPKLYVPVVTLSAEDNVKLTKQLDEGFKKSVYWNEYRMIDNEKVEITNAIMKNS